MDKAVYSTDPGWSPACHRCGKKPCSCQSVVKPKRSEPVRISFRRGHKGSGMTVIERLQMHPEGKENLLKKFKQRLGTGGTVKLGALELQGDHREFVEKELVLSGYKVRKIGG